VKKFPIMEFDGLPAQSTVYKWKCNRKYPRLIIKIGGQLFFDIDEWYCMAEKSRSEQIAEAKRFEV